MAFGGKLDRGGAAIGLDDLDIGCVDGEEGANGLYSHEADLAANTRRGQTGNVPLQWTISHPQRLVLAVAKGEVAPHEFSNYLAAIDDAKASGYRKMFDITGLTGELGDSLLRSVGRAVQERAREVTIGPIAIVATSDEAYFQAVAYADFAKVDRPLRIFRELHEARRWLDSFT